MKKHLSIVAAAALAVGAMGLSSAWAQQEPGAGQQLENAADRTGQAAKDAAQATGDTAQKAADSAGNAVTSSKEEIHDVLAQVAEAALTKEGLDDMAERFVDADRNRLGQNKDALKDTQEIDGRIAQIRTDWKAKYNQDFDIADEDKVYGGFVMISEGEIGAPRTAGDRVAAPAEGVDAPKANTDGQTAADKNLNDPGRNIATVTIPASHNMAEVKVPMVHEAGGWKIDIPDSVDAAKLREGVKSALSKCGDSKDKWPADQSEAYRAVTHEVLLALFADQAAGGAAAQPAAGREFGAQPGQQPRDPGAPVAPAQPPQ